MSSIFHKFTTHSRNALKNAFNLALASGHRAVTPQHILYGLSQQKGSIAAQILIKANIDDFEIKKSLTSHLPAKQTVTQVGLAPATKKVLEKSFLIANESKHNYIGTEHLLASIINTPDGMVDAFLEEQNVDIDDMQRQIDTILGSTSKFPDITNSLDEIKGDSKPEDTFTNFQSSPAPQGNMLENFATNLTDDVIQEEIDPVIGRQGEIDRLIQILSRRNKNNPLLLGDPGVGKTAIVEGLAKKITTGDIPEVLANKKIYTLDLSLVVAGTSFRGEFENRLKQIINEVKKDKNIILFIDEIHNIIGVGSATGSMDAANILKPALARGEIRCIGATTTEEYKKYIESDPALERRFQTIYVDQPSIEKTIGILKGIRENYESFHRVTITDEAINAAAQLSERYITDRFLPDKAIDLVDEAASAVKIKHLENKDVKAAWTLEQQLRMIARKKEDSVSKEKFSAALKYREQEEEILTKLRDLKKEKAKKIGEPIATITEKDIAQVVSKITGIPLDDLIVKEKNHLLNLEKKLSKRVIDQDEAIASIAEFIRRARTGIADANRPIGSFMFLGPSGVGKTELARVLAETVFGSTNSLIKIDMSEFAESFNMSKLIGAPAGYVGYKEGAKLTDSVKRRPYSVVLFDEIEKAHPQIFNMMLQILEEGHLTDATGKKINFKNTIIIMTSNLGSEHFNQQAAMGFQADTKDQREAFMKAFHEIQDSVLKKVKDTFPPEFISRIDKTVVFQPLTKNAINKITRLHLDELKERLAQQEIALNIANDVIKHIGNTSYAPEVGARAIRKMIQDEIENKIAHKMLSDAAATSLEVELDDKTIVVR